MLAIVRLKCVTLNAFESSGVTRRWGGPPQETPSRGNTRMKKNMAEFIKNTGQTRSEGGSCDETTGKTVITLQTAMTKKGRQFFSGKNRGDTVSCRPRVTPTLVTPLKVIIVVSKRSLNLVFGMEWEPWWIHICYIERPRGC